MLSAAVFFLLPIFGIACIGFLLIIAPQNMMHKNHQFIQKKIRLGSMVTTTTGLSGTVIAISKNHVILTCSDGAKKEILKNTIQVTI